MRRTKAESGGRKAECGKRKAETPSAGLRPNDLPEGPERPWCGERSDQDSLPDIERSQSQSENEEFQPFPGSSGAHRQGCLSINGCSSRTIVMIVTVSRRVPVRFQTRSGFRRHQCSWPVVIGSFRFPLFQPCASALKSSFGDLPTPPPSWRIGTSPRRCRRPDRACGGGRAGRAKLPPPRPPRRRAPADGRSADLDRHPRQPPPGRAMSSGRAWRSADRDDHPRLRRRRSG